MDLSKEVLTVLFLNAAGYLAAGGLLLVVFTLLRGRRKATSDSAGSNLQAADYRRGEAGDNAGERRQIEFVKFGEQSSPADATGAGDVRSKRTPARPATSRRNRIEVIGLARKMINAGASAEKIRAVLPISEAELALLSSQKN
jgi:hypothetical protein